MSDHRFWCSADITVEPHKFAGHMTCFICGAVNWKACYHAIADELEARDEA